MSSKQKQIGVVDGSGSSDEVQRWTASPKAAEALEIIKGNRNMNSARRLLPNPACLGDAAVLSAALSRAIQEKHACHYYPVTEERLATWKRVMDRIIKASVRESTSRFCG